MDGIKNLFGDEILFFSYSLSLSLSLSFYGVYPDLIWGCFTVFHFLSPLCYYLRLASLLILRVVFFYSLSLSLCVRRACLAFFVLFGSWVPGFLALVVGSCPLLVWSDLVLFVSVGFCRLVVPAVFATLSLDFYLFCFVSFVQGLVLLPT
ncbi:hypothetical protein QBC37DRAFT_136418 [Rhypophila decipiens]|uniref:Transmembrane protein n=1 Tax=Rhypophila decipiens TaxID=261697 RepID=A0AAN6YHM8_9PEZI|nr:hypothetical protein QBC37DRAFT_136418 [Rhypophila decipiens]